MEREILLAIAVIGCLWYLFRARTGGRLLYLLAAFWALLAANQFIRSRYLAVLSILLLAAYWLLGLARQTLLKIRWPHLQKRPASSPQEKIIEIEVEEIPASKPPSKP